MNKIDSVMTMFNSDRFQLVKEYCLDFAFGLENNYDRQDLLMSEMYYPGVALFLILKDKLRDGKLTLVVNTHLLYNIRKGHVKLSMIVLMFKVILKIKNNFAIDSIFMCGDFNLIPNSMLYSFIAHQKLDLNVDLGCFSGQDFAIDLRKQKSMGEATKIQNCLFNSSVVPRKYLINPSFPGILMNCDVILTQESKIIFRHNQEKLLTISEASDYFITLSQILSFNSVYAQVHRETVSKDGKSKEDMNFENGVSFYATSMASVVDYIWMTSESLKPDFVLKRPGVELLEAMPITAPYGPYPSDHFCLFAGFGKKN